MIKWNAPAVQELDVKMTANGFNPTKEEGFNGKDWPFKEETQRS